MMEEVNKLVDNQIDVLLRSIDDNLSRTLFNEGAKDEDIERLNTFAQIHVGLTITDELESLYRWHDGQVVEHIFGRGYNKSFLSIDETIESWLFFLDSESEYLKPYKKQWVPLLKNAFGDYTCYELETGRLVLYYHDDANRDQEFGSLKALLNFLLSSILDNVEDELDHFLNSTDSNSLSIKLVSSAPLQNKGCLKDLKSTFKLNPKEALGFFKGTLQDGITVSLSSAINPVEKVKTIQKVSKIYAALKDESDGVECMLSMRNGASILIQTNQFEKLIKYCL